MSTITKEQERSIAEYLRGRTIAEGLGDRESACSIAAINLALSGELTDSIPECMSEVIGQWILVVQDCMPYEMRNSTGWRDLLPLAAGTGRDLERKRLAILLDWMWGTVLPSVQPIADAGEFGEVWKEMCEQRTESAAKSAAEAAEASAWSMWAVAGSAWSAAEAARTVAASASWAARSASWAAAGSAAAWNRFDPIALLARLIVTTRKEGE